MQVKSRRCYPLAELAEGDEEDLWGQISMVEMQEVWGKPSSPRRGIQGPHRTDVVDRRLHLLCNSQNVFWAIGCLVHYWVRFYKILKDSPPPPPQGAGVIDQLFCNQGD